MTPGVYLLIKNNIVVYVGQTIDLSKRLHGHKNKDFDRYHFFKCDIPFLNWFELGLIERFNPIYNKSKCSNVSVESRILQIRKKIKILEKIVQQQENESI